MLFDNLEKEPRRLFLASLLLLVAFYLYITVAGLVTPGHDTFWHMSMQFFQCNENFYGEWFAKWIPSVASGTTGYFSITGYTSIDFNIINPLLYFLGKIAHPQLSFIPIYNIHYFFFEFVLLLGTWLLSMRLYESATTAFFVTVSGAMSCIWLEQYGFNIANFHAIPLVLVLVHRALDDEDGMALLLASLFALYTSLNVAVYSSVIQMVLYLSYFGTYLALHRDKIANMGRLLRPNLFGVVSLLVVLSAVAAMLYCSLHDYAHFGGSLRGRNGNGTVTLKVFNTWAGFTGPNKYLDILRGTNSKTPDLAVFRGYLMAALLPFGLLKLPRRGVPVLVAALVLFAFSFGQAGLVSTLLWYVFPGMRYYRHVAYVAPLVTFLFCFIAGFGFDALRTRSDIKKCMWLAIPVLIACVALSAGPIFKSDARSGFGTGQRAVVATIFAFVTLVVMYALSRSERRHKMLVGLLLVLTVLDIATYKIYIYNERALRLNKQEAKVWDFAPLQYQPQRFGTYFDTDSGRLFRRQFDRRYVYLVFYSSISVLLRHEPAGPGDLQILEQQDCVTDFYSLFEKDKNPGYDVIGGVTAPKIQFFSQAFAADAEQTRKLITQPEYQGGVLCVDAAPGAGLPDAAFVKAWNPTQDLHVGVPYTVTSFSSNHITLTFDPALQAPGWFFYSDGWSPRWLATVDKAALPVQKADLGFKAVWLPQGAHELTLTFVDKWLDRAILVSRILSFFMLAWLIRFSWRTFRTGRA